jgi:hypothetical protein
MCMGQRRTTGRVERAVTEAIRAAHRENRGAADARWRGAEALARQVAAALDTGADDPYAVAQLAPRLLAVLTELRLTPAAAGIGTDPLGDFFAELSAEPVQHAPVSAAEMGDPPQ